MRELPVINPPHQVTALIGHLSRRLALHAEGALAANGLRPRHLIALTLLRDLEELSQKDLAAALEIDRTNLVGLLNDLEADGLIERRRSPEDRRRHLVLVTNAGRERLAQAEFALGAVEDHVLAALDHAQREQLYALIARANSLHVEDAVPVARRRLLAPDTLTP